MHDDPELQRKFAAILPNLDERQRSLLAAAEARSLGYGGISRVSRASGISHTAIRRALKQLDAPPPPAGRVRRPGGGRKRIRDQSPAVNRPEVGQEDHVDLPRFQTRPFIEPMEQQLGRQRRVHQYGRGPLAYQHSGGVCPAHPPFVAPERVAAQRADTDYVNGAGHGLLNVARDHAPDKPPAETPGLDTGVGLDKKQASSVGLEHDQLSRGR